jgi:uncharacterized OB-fold protein
MELTPDLRDCFTVPGKLALPYTYFAGRIGSRFLLALQEEHRILGVRCAGCATVLVPPRATCDRCQADLADTWVEVGPAGRVENFTVVRYADRHVPEPVPLVLALIRLDGADTPLVHRLGGMDPEAVRVGLRVTAVFAAEPRDTLLCIDHFRPLAPQPSAAGPRPQGG